ncbi:MAG: CHAT domain-containing protein [Pseudomonadota bacterium]
MVNVIWHEDEAVVPLDDGAAAATLTRSGGGRSAVPDFLNFADVADVFDVVAAKPHRVQGTVRSATVPQIAVSLDVDDGEDYRLIVRHPSGAISFHDGPEMNAAGKVYDPGTRRAKSYRKEFRADVALSADDDVRRSFFDRVVDAAVDAIVVRVKNFVAAKTVDLAELAIWKVLGRTRGLHRISKGSDTLTLTPVSKMAAGPQGRALLFIHGTFSTTQGSFGDLNASDFLDRVTPIYGEHIYGFEHFTVSVTPQDNAEDILKTLPAVGLDCDVITQSRGGLVLRNLVERAAVLKNGDRFRLGRAALVASPNEGTQLATPDRWQDTVGWVANILDLFPPNPVTSNAAMLAHWITWFTKFGVNAAEGLDAMNRTGDQIRTLQRPPGPPTGAYSAIVSNFEPTAKLWARALDLGVDWIFGEANDLVVPTAGGVRVDRNLDFIPRDQIGVYGPGGNLVPEGGPVHHMNSFAQSQTQDFLFNALTGAAQGLPPFDPDASLPTSKRSAEGTLSAVERLKASASPQLASPAPEAAPSVQVAPQKFSSVFEIFVGDARQIARAGVPLGKDADTKDDAAPFVVATYGGARVALPFSLVRSPKVPKGVNPTATRQIEAMRDAANTHRGGIFGAMKKVAAAAAGTGAPLSAAEMRDFGHHLFHMLLQGEIKRLYDMARSREQEKLFLVFTSTIPWVSDIPWELAYDLDQRAHMVTGDVHFIRNVLTPNPVNTLVPGRKLRLLVVSSEPRDQPKLSTVEETARLRHALRYLERAGLVEIEELPRATRRDLHLKIGNGNFDILHFIGHGYWNFDTGESGLVLETAQGTSDRLGDDALRDVLSRRGLRMAFLNACDTGRGLRQDIPEVLAPGGVAQDLFAAGVPNVIANQFPVGDRAAVIFARAVYDFLARGATIAKAMREARIAVKSETNHDPLVWATPVLFARDPEDRLVIRGSGDV